MSRVRYTAEQIINVAERTLHGRASRPPTVIGEYIRRWLAITVQWRLRSDEVLHCVTEWFVRYDPPDHFRSNYGPAFTAEAVPARLGRLGMKNLFIESGSP